MDDEELEQCRAMLGVTAGASLDHLERALMIKNFALIKGRSGAAGDALPPEIEAQKQQLRAAYEKLVARVREEQQAELAKRKRPVLPPAHAPKPSVPLVPLKALPATAVERSRDPIDDEFILFRFHDWRVNTFVPPLLLALVLLVNLSPLKFLLTGFHVWMHEFGHATAAWLCGFRATPLPFGWTPVEPVYSPFVYWGVLLLFAILFAAGVKERKVWPMIAALALAGLQYYMTWKMPEHRQEFWWSAFGGVGGEFYLSTLFMMFFWVQLPEKFKWGACRYVFFLIGATAFLNIWLRWRDVYTGLEEIPFGSMINGEDDQGGDMNKLMDGYGWKKFDIRRNYLLLGYGCWTALGLMWLLFVFRLNRAADWVVGRFRPVAPAESA
jgi:hypothetical protein